MVFVRNETGPWITWKNYSWNPTNIILSWYTFEDFAFRDNVHPICPKSCVLLCSSNNNKTRGYRSKQQPSSKSAPCPLVHKFHFLAKFISPLHFLLSLTMMTTLMITVTTKDNSTVAGRH